MSSRIFVVGLSVAVAVAVSACAERAVSQDSPSVHRGRRADAIQGGAADVTSTFAVVILDDQNGICSGTLIAPNLVLTARHCVASDTGGDSVDCAHDRFNAPNPASTLRVSFAAEAPDFKAAEFKVTKVIVPTDALFCGNDLALIILDKLVPASAAKPAIPAIDPPLTDRAKYAKQFSAIGYGITGPGLNDEGTRRTRNGVPITCIPGDATLGCDLVQFDMTASEMAAGNGLCEGDSGSGAFEPGSLATGTPIVMGVLSRASDLGSQCADSIYGRTDTASALLIAAAKEAAITGGYRAPTWADPTGSTAPEAGAPVVPDSGDPDGGATSGAGSTTTTTGCAIASSPGLTSHRDVYGAGLGAALVLVLASRRRRRARR